MRELKQKSKIKFNIDGPNLAKENSTEKRWLREEQGYELLLRPLLDGKRILLSDIKNGRYWITDESWWRAFFLWFSIRFGGSLFGGEFKNFNSNNRLYY